MSVVMEYELKDKTITFTGRLHLLSKKQAVQLLEQAGAVVEEQLNRQTHLVVVGMGGWPIHKDGSISRKLSKAEQLQAQGHPIQIISEPVLLEKLGLQASPSSSGGTCSIERAARILGVSEEAIRRWALFDLLRIDNGQVDFQDLVSLRHVAELISQGIPPAAIAKGLHELSKRLPADRPLAQARIMHEAGELVADIQGIRIDTQGQLLLDFADTQHERAPSVLIKPFTRHDDESADAWFTLGQEQEQQQSYEQAVESYQKALQYCPGWAIAHYNCGNVLFTLKKMDEAASHFRDAAEADPGMAEAWYNLAYLEDERNNLEAAIHALHKALDIVPDFADAHFNLARCLSLQGQSNQARVHWKRYLQLDPNGAWAAIARIQLGHDKV